MTFPIAVMKTGSVREQTKIGRPKLPKGEAKGHIVPVRFNTDDLERIKSAAEASQKTVSEWIRSTIASVIEAQ